MAGTAVAITLYVSRIDSGKAGTAVAITLYESRIDSAKVGFMRYSHLDCLSVCFITYMVLIVTVVCLYKLG